MEATEVTPEVTTTVRDVPQPKVSFKDYKQQLKNEVELAELRARIAKAYFEELAAGNQYNQLRAALEAQAKASQRPGDDSPSDASEPEVTPEAVPEVSVEQS